MEVDLRVQRRRRNRLLVLIVAATPVIAGAGCQGCDDVNVQVVGLDAGADGPTTEVAGVGGSGAGGAGTGGAGTGGTGTGGVGAGAGGGLGGAGAGGAGLGGAGSGGRGTGGIVTGGTGGGAALAITAVYSHNDHTCALSSAGTVRCWGYNVAGQLGYGNTNNNVGVISTPASAGDVDVGGKVTQLALGTLHTCALLDNGHVRCWGDSMYGQLGHGNKNRIGDNETPASAGDVDIGGLVTQLAAGDSYTCALLANGHVRCWGLDTVGTLGYATAGVMIGDDETPASSGDVDLGGTVVQLAAGQWHTCAVLQGGAVRCWGRNNGAGNLGYGNEEHVGDNETPASAGDVDIGGVAIGIAVGAAHSCAVLQGGAVRCWGSGPALGYGNNNVIGDDESPSSAGDVPVGGAVLGLAAANRHTCALLQGGAVRCWGQGLQGQLGYGNTDAIGDNEPASAAGSVNIGGTVTQIAAGTFHSCAVLSGGTVRCWGTGTQGGLGYVNNGAVIGDNETPASAGDVIVY